MLEARWTRLPEPEYEAEREVVGDLDALDVPATEARLEAASGHTGQELDTILGRLRADDPADPFWKGFAGKTVEPNAVTMRFHEGIEPREVEAGPSRVRCHLYDDAAMARAKQAADA
jgi:peptide/nickel transport system ATP-binding protein